MGPVFRYSAENQWCQPCNIKGEFWYFKTWALFLNVNVSYLLKLWELREFSSWLYATFFYLFFYFYRVPWVCACLLQLFEAVQAYVTL